MTLDQQKEWLSVKEVAQIAELSVSTVGRYSFEDFSEFIRTRRLPKNIRQIHSESLPMLKELYAWINEIGAEKRTVSMAKEHFSKRWNVTIDAVPEEFSKEVSEIKNNHSQIMLIENTPVLDILSKMEEANQKRHNELVDKLLRVSQENAKIKAEIQAIKTPWYKKIF